MEECIQVFLEYRGFVEQATSVGKVMANAASISADRLQLFHNINIYFDC